MSEPCSIYKQTSQALHREERGPDLHVTVCPFVWAHLHIWRQPHISIYGDSPAQYISRPTTSPYMGTSLHMETAPYLHIWTQLMSQLRCHSDVSSTPYMETDIPVIAMSELILMSEYTVRLHSHSRRSEQQSADVHYLSMGPGD